MSFILTLLLSILPQLLTWLLGHITNKASLSVHDQNAITQILALNKKIEAAAVAKGFTPPPTVQP